MAAESFERRENGVESLEQRYRHLDDRVERLGQEVAGISATLSQVSHTLEAISRRVNEPQRTQWSAIIAACAFIASLGYSALMPVKEHVVQLGGRLDQVQARQREVAELEGEVRALRGTLKTEHDRTHEELESVRARVREIEQRTAGQAARLEEVDERLRDVDMAGSRKWLAPSR